jgi:predicted nucleic acid-binding protein
MRVAWPEIDTSLGAFGDIFTEIAPLTLSTHKIAVTLAKTDSLSIFDALIVASAREAGCDILYSEGLRNGRTFGVLTVVNPFV